MECIILAGGLGTRLQSVLNNLPKCMAPVAGQPFLYYIFKYLEKQKVSHIILSIGYKNETIKEWVCNNSWPFFVSYAVEDEPLGTGGAIKHALQQTSEEHVLIMNGDTFFDVNLEELYNEHMAKKADLSIALKPMKSFDRYGNVLLDENNRITSFVEKHFCKEGHINGGTYMLNCKSGLMEQLGDKFSFETDVLQNQFSNCNMFGYIENGYFIDIGVPIDFEKANLEFINLI